MKVCGFSFVRNAIKYGYPIKEAILSVLPVCDHFVIAVGNSEDGTLDYIKSIGSDKIEIIETVWDDSLRTGGAVLAVETNKAFDAIKSEYDWCFYIQGDEVVHEKYHTVIRSEMERWKDHPEVEGLLFKYQHFWGTYDYVGNSRNWYRREIRVIKNNKEIRSYRDAQGFRKNDQKLKVKLIDAYIYHYGWVKNPATMMDKLREFNKLWHDDDWVTNKFKDQDMFDYSEVNSIKLFGETHPAVMQKLIDGLNWKLELDPGKVKLSFKDKVLHILERITGKRFFEYRNYQII
jgi:hypothetical protein